MNNRKIHLFAILFSLITYKSYAENVICTRDCQLSCQDLEFTDDCLQDCGCTSDDIESQLQEVVLSYNDMTSAQQEADVQLQKIAYISQSGSGDTTKELEEATDCYKTAKTQAKEKESQLKQSQYQSGIDESCNMGCVSGCSQEIKDPLTQCYTRCGCKDGGVALQYQAFKGTPFGGFGSQWMTGDMFGTDFTWTGSAQIATLQFKGTPIEKKQPDTNHTHNNGSGFITLPPGILVENNTQPCQTCNSTKCPTITDKPCPECLLQKCPEFKNQSCPSCQTCEKCQNLNVTCAKCEAKDDDDDEDDDEKKESCKTCETCQKCQNCSELQQKCPDCVQKESVCPSCQTCQTCNKTECPAQKVCPSVTCPNCTQEKCPDCVVTKCPEVKCNTTVCEKCVDNSYLLKSIEKRNKLRVTAISIAQYVVNTHYPQYRKNISSLDFENELFILNEAHFTVKTFFQDIKVFVKVENIEGIDNAYSISYYNNDKLYTLYVVLDQQSSGLYNSALISQETLQVIYVFQVTVFQNPQAFTGYGFSIKQIDITPTLSKIIATFIKRYENLLLIKRNIISASHAVTLHVHDLLNAQSNLNWRVQVSEFNEKLSTFSISGHNKTGKQVVAYKVSTVEDAEHKNVYTISVTYTNSAGVISFTADVVVMPVKDVNYKYYNVILLDGSIENQIINTIAVRQGYFEVYSQVFDVIPNEMKDIIQSVNAEKDVLVVYKEANAAVVGLIRWVLNLDYKDVEMTSSMSTETSSTVTVSLLSGKKGPWNAFVRQIQWQSEDSLYYCKLKYPSGNSVAYYVYVKHTKDLQYEISVLHDGSSILVSYATELEHVKGTDVFRIKTVTVITDDSHKGPIENYQNLTGNGNNVKPTVIPGQLNQTSVITVTLSNVTTTETVSKTTVVQVYSHPKTGEEYWLYQNNSVVLGSSGKIVSPNGGLQWILQLFLGSVDLQQQKDYSTYKYDITGETWKIYPDGKVTTNDGIFVTNGGIEALIKIISQRATKSTTNTVQYTVYTVEGTSEKYKVFTDGSVTTFQSDNLICQKGGLKCLLEYLTHTVESHTTEYPDYDLATDQKTGTQYYIFRNTGKVTTLDGVFVCWGGLDGLAQYLLSGSLITTNFELTSPDYQIVETTDGRKFYLHFPSGKSTLPDGTFVCDGGLEGLKKYLASLVQPQKNDTISVTIPTVANVTKPTYQIFNYNGDQYIYYIDGTITNKKNELITKDGFEGFLKWILSQAGKIEDKVINYEIAVDETTGDEYFIYENGTVKTSDGIYICDGGVECLEDYLKAKTDKYEVYVDVIDTYHKDITIQYKSYIDTNGVEWWILKDGRVYNPKTKQAKYIFHYDSFVKKLTYKSTGQLKVAATYYLVAVEGSGDKYYIYNDGSVHKLNGEFLCTGGVTGLQKFLTVKKIVVQMKEDNEKLSIDLLNLNYGYKNYYLLDERNTNESVFCKTNSKANTYDCLFVYLSQFYYRQILSTIPDDTMEVFVDGEGNQYYIFSTGRVTTSLGDFICTGGVPCLINYLHDKYDSQNKNVSIGEKKPSSGIVEMHYNSYVDTEGVYHWHFDNGTLVNTKNGSATQDYQTIIKGLKWVKDDKVAEKMNYTQVKISGDDSYKYVVYANGNVFYKFKYFICFGGEEGLVKYLTVRNNINTQMIDNWIHVNALNIQFQYLDKPDRLTDEQGDEICRTTSFKGAYSCMIRYLIDNYWTKFHPVDVKNENFSKYISDDGVTYFIYENNTVTTSTGEFICDKGVKCLIDFLKNQHSDIKVIKKSTETIVENMSIYVNKVGKEYTLFQNKSLRNESSGQFILKNAYQIATKLKFVGFKTFEYQAEVTTVLDTQRNTQYKIKNSDGNCYTMNNKYVTNKGITGLRQFLQVYVNLDGENDTKFITFKSLNLKFKYQTDPYSVRDPRDKIIVLPLPSEEEAYYALYNYIIFNKLFQLAFKADQEYSLYADTQGNIYTVYPNGIVTTHDDNQTLICSTGGVKCLSDYLNKKKVAIKDDFVTIYQGSDGINYSVYPSGVVETTDTKKSICKEGGYDCLINYLNGKQDQYEVDYQVYEYKDVQYYVYEDDSVKLENGTVICKTGGLPCLNKYLSNLIVKPDPAVTSYKTVIDSNTGDKYKVYLSGSVTFDNGTFICMGGMDGLQDWLLKQQQANSKSYEIVKTDDNKTFLIYKNGTVIQDDNKAVICKKNGYDCLVQYLKQNTPQLYSQNGFLFYVYNNGSVFFYNGGMLCLSGSYQCILDWLEDQEYTLFVANGEKFYIYGNGSVFDSKNKQICETGGDICLNKWLIDQQPQYTQYKFGNRTFNVYNNGSVIDVEQNQEICKVGGLECLTEYLSPKYEEYKFGNSTFQIYKNGKVLDQNGIVICLEGGLPCLQKYIQTITPTATTYTIGDKTYVFNVYQNGTAIDEKGKVICTKDADKCIQDYLLELNPHKYQHKVGKINYEFSLFNSGRVTDQNGTEICKKGGEECLQKWIHDNSPSIVQIEDESYYIYSNGLVETEDGTVICETGGQDCLEQWYLSTQVQEYQIDIGPRPYTFNIYGTGKVTNKVTGEIICETDGADCLQEWINENSPQVMEYDDQVYYIYPSGLVEDWSGEVICEEGGEECLTNYLMQSSFQEIAFQIGKHDYVYWVYGDGKVTDNKGEVICEEGGQDCLQEWLELNTPQEIMSGNTPYYVWPSGKVEDYDDKVICETGGQKCLEDWIKSQQVKTMSYQILGETFTFKIFPNQTVLNQDGRVICLTGGQACLQKWVVAHTPQEYKLKKNGVTQSYYIYPNSKVIFKNKTVICEFGGQACLTKFINGGKVIDGKFQDVTYDINGTNTKFRIYDNGTVLDDKGKLICKSGGFGCLEDYISDLYAEKIKNATEPVVKPIEKVKPDQYNFTINKIPITCLVDTTTGKVTDDKGNVICEKGGKKCLDDYINELKKNATKNYQQFTYTIGGVTTTYTIDPTGKVTDDKDKVICKTGGKDCLDDYIDGLTGDNTPDQFTYVIDGKPTTFTVDPIGKVTDDKGKVVCKTGGKLCLDLYVDSLLGNSTSTDNYLEITYSINDVLNTFRVNLDPIGKVTDVTGGSGKEKLICKSGGEPCLNDYINKLVSGAPINETLTYVIDGKPVNFTVDPTGKVTDDKGKVVCKTGGKQCLEEIINKKVKNATNPDNYELVTYTIDDVPTTFKVDLDDTGKVTDITGGKGNEKVVCKTGGKPCLEEYIENISNDETDDEEDEELEFIIDDVPVNFTIVKPSGDVIDGNGKIVCKAGGKKCIDDIISKKLENSTSKDNYQIVKADINDFSYTFKVYLDKVGKVTDVTGNTGKGKEIVVCKTGGLPCLEDYIDKLTTGKVTPDETFKYVVDGKPINFTVDPTGKVTDNNGKEVCKTGGKQCIDDLVEALVNNATTKDNYQVVDFDFNDVPLTFKVYLDEVGKVTDVTGNTGKGKETVICKTGGMPCLEEYLDKLVNGEIPDEELTYIIDGKPVNFTVDPTGKVTDNNGKEVCKTGGKQCVDAIVEGLVKNATTKDNYQLITKDIFDVPTTFKVNLDTIGQVTDLTNKDGNGKEKLICKTGGEPCLDDYIEKLLNGEIPDEVFTFVIDGKPINFTVDPTGKVTDDKGKVVCKTGGKPCIDDIVEGLIKNATTKDNYELITKDIKDVPTTFKVDLDDTGKVTDLTNNDGKGKDKVVCKSGGQPCLEEYIEKLLNDEIPDEVYTYVIDGKPITFTVDPFGEVKNNDTGKVVCKTGGKQCLEELINGLVAKAQTDDNYKLVTKDIKDVPTTFKVNLDDTGKVTDLTNNDGKEKEKVICKSGGEPCLDDYIEKLLNDEIPDEVVTYVIDGKPITFTVDPFGEVKNNDTGKVVCKTGGKQCLEEYIDKLVANATTDDNYKLVTKDIKDVPHTFKVNLDETGQVTDVTGNKGKGKVPVICKSGGEPCLDDYIEKLLNDEIPDEVFTYIIDGKPTTFTVDPFGEVTNNDTGKVVCKTGGKQCLEEFINKLVANATTDDNYELATYDINDVPTTFKINLDETGQVTDVTGNTGKGKAPVICQSGGKPCLEDYIESLLNGEIPDETYTYVIDGVPVNFTVNPATGKVTDGDGKVVCKTGGKQCLEEFIDSLVANATTNDNYELVTYDVEDVPITFKVGLDETGRVTEPSSNKNGKEKLICVSGGIPCLEAYIDDVSKGLIPDEKYTYNIDGKPVTYTVTPAGKVTDDNGKVICKTDGKACLDKYIDNLLKNSTSKDNFKLVNFTKDEDTTLSFRVDLDKVGKVTEVTDGKSEVICKTGGEPCLEEYVNKMRLATSDDEFTYVIDDVPVTFTVDPTGKVTDDKGKVVCKTGGKQCLEKYVDELIAKAKTDDNYQIINITIDGELSSYKVDLDKVGKVTDITDEKNEKVVCKAGGQPCLENYIQSLLTGEPTIDYEQYTYVIDGVPTTYTVDPDGKVVDENGKVICKLGGKECLDAYIDGLLAKAKTNSTNNYEEVTVDIDDEPTTFRVYLDDVAKVTDNAGNATICETGGKPCLDEFIKSLEGGDEYTYIIDGVPTTYTVNPIGKVKDEDGKIICKTGGKQCLDDYIDKLVANSNSTDNYQEVQYTIDDETYKFRVGLDEVGKVTDDKGNEICKSGGQLCLDDYIDKLLFDLDHKDDDKYTYIIDGVPTTFYVDPTGEVSDEDDKVICKTGGKQCLDDYIDSLIVNAKTEDNYEEVTVDIDEEPTTFRVYLDEVAKVTDETGNVTICETGGKPCLDEFIKSLDSGENDEKYTYTIDGVSTTYSVNPIGRVTDEYGNVICKRGGKQCLDDYINGLLENAKTEDNYEEVTITIDGESTVYRVYLDDAAKVTDETGKLTICETGGQPCLLEFIQSQLDKLEKEQTEQYTYTIDDVSTTYTVDPKGKVTDDDGNVICKKFGKICLDAYIDDLLSKAKTEDNYETVVYTIDEVPYTFFVGIDSVGKVTDDNGNVICKTGGQPCLDDYIEKLLFDLEHKDDEQFTYTIDGVPTTYYVDPTGKVVDENGKVICEKGGKECLDAYIDDLLSKAKTEDNYQTVVYTIDDIPYTFFVGIDKIGKVTDDNGNVICAAGGQPCLDAYIEKFVEDLQNATDKQFTYTIDGVSTTYTVTPGGKVTDDNDNVICKKGGKKCLESYIDDLLSKAKTEDNFQTVVYTIDEVPYTFQVGIDSVGKVTDDNGNVICKTGGQPCLDDYIEKLLFDLEHKDDEQFTYTIDGVPTTYYVDPTGKVVDENGKVICEKGGKECLEAYIDDLVSKAKTEDNYQTVVYTIDDIPYTFQVGIDSVGKVTDDKGKVICKTGGQPCLDAYIEKFVEDLQNKADEQLTYTIDGVSTTYTVTPAGKVTDDNDKVICKTGGKQCLGDYIDDLLSKAKTEDNFQTVIYTIDGTPYTFQVGIDSVGKVTDDKGKVVCPSGGQPCLDEYIEKFLEELENAGNEKFTYTIDGVSTTYSVTPEGKVTDDNGKVICKTGGKQCLESYIDDLLAAAKTDDNFQTVVYTIDGVPFTFQVGLNAEGKVTDDQGKVVCATGGQPCLDDYIAAFLDSIEYAVDEDFTYAIDGVPTKYIVSPLGKVTDDKGKVICAYGGAKCLDIYIDGLLAKAKTQDNYQEIEVILDDVSTKYKIYLNAPGKVIDDKGTVICDKGGLPCFDGFVQSLINPPASEFQTFTIDGVTTTYEIQANGKVVTDEGVVVCKTGGEPCLDTFIADLLEKAKSKDNFELFIYTIDGVSTTYKVGLDKTAKVTLEDGTIICNAGGADCLADYIDAYLASLESSVDYREYTYTVDDVATTYRVDAEGKVTTDAGVVICKTGGSDCLESYIEDLINGVTQTAQEDYQQFIYTIDGVKNLYIVESSGRVLTGEESKIICKSGGQSCLEDYVSAVMSGEIEVTAAGLYEIEIAGVKVVVSIDASGKVTDPSGNVLCKSGGVKCMDDYVATLSKPVDAVKSIGKIGSMFFSNGNEVKGTSYSSYLIYLVVLIIVMSIAYDAIQLKLNEVEKRKPQQQVELQTNKKESLLGGYKEHIL